MMLHVFVKDSGIGIPEQKQKLIFEAFSQSDASMTRTYGGTGLGLTISQQLVELMGGRIWVESEFGKGSTFHFTLQCRLEKNSLPQSKHHPIAISLNNLRVLVVDDNSTNCLVLCEMLSNWGMKPFSIEKPEKALEVLKYAETVNDSFKLVITDYQMPHLTGLQLAKIIRESESYKDIPIVVLSSVCSISALEEKQHLSLVNGFIDKPVRQSILLEKIEGVVGKHTNELPKPVQTQQTDIINRNLQILVAEDNPTNQMVIGGFFEKQGINNVTIVDNGQKAVDAYQNAVFDVIFMDVRMPEMDGFQATAAIRELEAQQNLPHTTIVALTAHALKEDEEICLSKGMDYYTSKPIKPDELLKLLALVSKTLPENTEDKVNAALSPEKDIFNLNAALAPVGGDKVVFKRIIDIYLKTYALVFAELKQAVMLKDIEKVYDRAHALKGSASNFAAHTVVELSAQLEQMGKIGNIEGAENVVAELEKALSSLVGALEQFKNGDV
jgi:CheY-like chemotaxis protein